MPSAKTSIAKDTFIFTLASLVSQTVAFGLAIYIRNTLGPEAMGLWALLQVVLSYISYTNLGIMNAVCREVPVLRGRGVAEEEITAMKNLGYTYLSLVSFVTCAGVTVAAFLLRARISEAFFWGLLVIALMTLFERNVGYRVQILYTDKKFQLVSRFRVYSSLVNAALVMALCWRFGLYGFYLAVLFSFVFDICYLKIKARTVFGWSWQPRRIAGLLTFGVPLVALSFATTFFSSIDKVSIGKFLGLRELGVYTLALMAGRYVFLLPNMFQVVLLPSTMEKFGQTSEAARIKHATLPGRIMILYFALCLGVIWIAAPLGCKILLPKYVGGLAAMKALIFGYAFMALSQQMGHILLGHRRHLWMLGPALVLAGLLWAASAWVVGQGGGLWHVAALMSAFQLVYYLLSSFFGLSVFYEAKKIVTTLLINVVPLGVSLMVLLAFDRFYPQDNWLSVAAKLCVYAALWCCLVLMFEKDTGVLKLLGETWRRRWPQGAAPETAV